MTKTNLTTSTSKQVPNEETKEVFVEFKDVVVSKTQLSVTKISSECNVTRKSIFKKGKLVQKIVSKREINRKEETLEFSLVKVSSKRLTTYRYKGIPCFVLKVDGQLFYSRIPDELNLMPFNIIGEHQCYHSGNVCHRLSATSDEHNGCEKVRNGAKYIENYPWITSGYETFNTNYDVFVVLNCLHYQKEITPCQSLSIREINNAKLLLAQFIWPDVESFADIKVRRERSKK